MLAGFLAPLEGEDLSGHDRVLALAAYQKMVSYFQAKMLGEMAAICDLMAAEGDDPEVASEAAAAEIRVALRLTRRAADSDLALAWDLKHRLPRVWEALEAGEIDLRRVRVIVAGTAHLAEETARQVVDEIIERAARLTTGQLHALLRRVCLETDPAGAADRYRQAVAERRVVMEPSVDGTAHLSGFDLAPDRAAAAMRRIDHLAQTLKTGGEARTLDQLRADVFLDLLEGHRYQADTGKGTVDLHVDLKTLTRLADHPGELAGYGPIVADVARQIAESQTRAEWRWTLTDPDTGQVIDNGTTRRRPDTGQRRHVETRNPTCIFPGCRVPATDCDLDHRTPWSEGGPTTLDNLVPLCRHDHQIRHRTGWTHQPLPEGDHQWTSRLGHTYTSSGRSP
jgi:uncharacterized protein DUF222/HNH endonuclease